jgi:hypothetical protein
MLENPARWDDLKAMGFETPKELTKGKIVIRAWLRLETTLRTERNRERLKPMGTEKDR